MQAKLKVLQVGPFVSVQDKGRPGNLRFGVTESGVMDRMSHALANAALNNPDSNPAVEVSLGGITLECLEGTVSMAIAGGHFSSSLNDNALPAWSVFKVTAGDIIKIRPGKWGSWCYLAIAGQIESQRWLNSHSVHLNSGVCGRPLQQYDELHVNNATANTNDIASLGNPDSMEPLKEIRVVIGPQERYFDKATLDNFLKAKFTISNEYDRMGMRLSGCTLPIAATLDMLSEPLSRGSLQVPGHGDPICLMADHHTAGGYPKIATVISADQDVLAQHRSGDSISFTDVSTAEAVQAARDKANYTEQLLSQMQISKVSVAERLWKNNLISGAFLLTSISSRFTSIFIFSQYF